MDIALEAGIADPPNEIGGYEAPRLRKKVKSWLAEPPQRLPREVLISTPVLAIETWVIAALFPKQARPEAIQAPADYLLMKKKLRKSPKDGSPWKELHRYRDFGSRVAKALTRVRRTCPEADRTCNSIESRRSEST